MPASARTCWTPRTSRASSWHTRNTAGETGRFSRTGPESRGVAAGTTARRPSGSSGWRRSPGTSSIRSNRAGRSMRTTVCRSARHSTPPPAHSKASTRPDNATVSAVKPPLPAGSPGNLRLERAWKPHVHPGSGARWAPRAPAPALGPGVSRIAGTARQRNEPIARLPGQLAGPHHPLPVHSRGQVLFEFSG